MSQRSSKPTAAVIGGGPAGLMAAEQLAQAGVAVTVYDAMRSVGRKFLLAGRGGLNITHSEPLAEFLGRYGRSQPHITPLLTQFGPNALRTWVHNLGIETFVGSSGRVFPTEMKAAPLLRTWLKRLRTAGVQFQMQHRWLGWAEDGALRFATPDGEKSVRADVVILALGGASWPKLGSDGGWVPLLAARGVEIAPLLPANCGFNVSWSDYFRQKFAGEPVKTVVLHHQEFQQQGEFVITETGVEGSLIYAASAQLREAILANGQVTCYLDLLPDRSETQIANSLAKPRGSRSMANHLQSRLRLKGVKAGLLRELAAAAFDNPAKLATAIKRLPLTLVSPRPVAEAISTAGGVTFAALDKSLMLRAVPGVFCAGEMLDWEAPTGGYLLTACFASGRAAGLGALDWLNREEIGPILRDG
ncbi:MAG: TIGR03862 family flavoprotein [Anaerolineales bacterium]|nr:TIGR03862 family flavoprotein [Anaerolineales bacterium]